MDDQTKIRISYLYSQLICFYSKYIGYRYLSDACKKEKKRYIGIEMNLKHIVEKQNIIYYKMRFLNSTYDSHIAIIMIVYILRQR